MKIKFVCLAVLVFSLVFTAVMIVGEYMCPYCLATHLGNIAFWLLMEFDKHDPEYQFRSLHEWIPSLGISWHLGVDGIS